MDEFTIVALSVGLGVPLIFAFVISIILIVGRARPKPGLGPRTAHPGLPAREGTWNAMILADSPIGSIGGTLGSRSGTFHIEQGLLSFTPDTATVPEWAVPCHQIAARAHSAFGTAGVTLRLPTGVLRCNVSREHINRFSRNSIKSLREPTYYREFVGVLLANGARHG